MNQRSRVNRCTMCGVEYDVESMAKLRTMIVGASGKPNAFVVSAAGVEVHRCELNEAQMRQAEDEVSRAQAS